MNHPFGGTSMYGNHHQNFAKLQTFQGSEGKLQRGQQLLRLQKRPQFPRCWDDVASTLNGFDTRLRKCDNHRIFVSQKLEQNSGRAEPLCSFHAMCPNDGHGSLSNDPEQEARTWETWEVTNQKSDLSFSHTKNRSIPCSLWAQQNHSQS